MSTEHRNTKIEINELLLRKIAYAISKAINDDLPQERRENHLETNNRHRMAAGDYINENLRNLVVDENVTLHPFSRGGWDGRILVDNVGKVTYTIMRETTLQNAMNRKKNTIYYLQSLLVNENGDCKGHGKQLYLFDEPTMFSDEDYEEDFDRIMKGVISRTDGYRHYVFVYETKNSEIISLELRFLDGEYALIDSIDLMSYITPDFAALTSTAYADKKLQKEPVHEEPSRELIKVRPGIKPMLREEEQEV